VGIKNIFLTGGSGTLGSQMILDSASYNINFVSPSSEMCNIRVGWQVDENIKKFEGDTIVHCAAFTDVKSAEKNPLPAACINVLGTFNILQSCVKYKKRLVYISTDYVFDGKKGSYRVDDYINPLSNYAKTKAAAELLVRTYNNSLVIRTSFYGKYFPYERALTDQWTSKDYVDIISPLVIDSIMKHQTGIIHVGSPKSTVYEIAKRRSKSVIPISMQDLEIEIPRDTSFHIDEKS
jgi:dTDP-4-dehydrorhamnose reductase